MIIIIRDRYLKFILSKRDKTQLQTSQNVVCNSFYANVQGKRLCHHSSKATRILHKPLCKHDFSNHIIDFENYFSRKLSKSLRYKITSYNMPCQSPN